MRLKLQADNYKRVQTTTITCIHKHTHVTHGNTFASTTFAKHPRYIVHMLKKRGNEFWWLRKLGVQGCSTKWLCQCNLRMVPLLGILGFFFAITRNARSTHFQSSKGAKKGKKQYMWPREWGVWGRNTKGQCQCVLWMVMVNGISGIFSNIIRNAMSALLKKKNFILSRNHRKIG